MRHDELMQKPGGALFELPAISDPDGKRPCDGLIAVVRSWTDEVQTEAGGGFEKHRVALFRCQLCTSFIVVDHAVDRIVNQYQLPPLPSDRASDRDGERDMKSLVENFHLPLSSQPVDPAEVEC